MVSAAIGIAALAVGVPLAGADTCAFYCFVPAEANAAANITDGRVDDYWRDKPRRAIAATSAIDQSLVGSPRPAPAVRTAASTFDWGDFGIGVGAAGGSMLVLAGLGTGVLVFRLGHRRRTSAAETA